MKKFILVFVFSQLTSSCIEDKAVCVNESTIDATVLCPKDFSPVCGCNNTTYNNACEAENKAGVNLYTQGQCDHTCTYNDTLMVFATDENCTLLSDLTTFFEVDYAPEGTLWEKDQYYFINRIPSENTPNCGGSESIDVLCSILFNMDCRDLFSTEEFDTQLPKDSLHIEQVSIANNCITVNYSYLGGCNDTRLNLYHLVDSSSTLLARLQLRFDNGEGPCTDTVQESSSFNLTTLNQENQNSITISIDCNGDRNFNETLNYVY